MPTATSRRAAPDRKVLEERRRLCEDRIVVERLMAPLEAQAQAIDARLKVIATEADESFKETFEDGSFVQASGEVAAEFKGNVPVIQTEAWQALKPAEQKAHVKSGLVKIEEQWGRKSGGKVTVKIFGAAA